jgi:U3 small nucleolar ribonucleoprotein protein IMP4
MFWRFKVLEFQSFDHWRWAVGSHAEGKPIPTELRGESNSLKSELTLEDEQTAEYGARSHVDDEYAKAGEQDPKIMLTTSRDPSSRLAQFAKVR